VSEFDPRIYFAAERTLLAWVRTGANIIGLGFVVARFGLFLRLVNPTHPPLERVGFSGALGVAVAIGGALMTLLATVQFVAFRRELGAESLPRTRLSFWLSVISALMVSALGIVLGIYLLA
jgi:putative membrane protein